MSAPITVQKYGGTSVGTSERLQNVARRIAARAAGGDRVIAVVSAMGKTTDSLVALAREITPNPAGREYDMLLASGEIVSAALLAMALDALGVPAIGLTGAQAGVFTDDTHNRARITRIETDRIMTAMDAGQVVIIAGFQGISPHSDFTTLGRGGSDTSAVALAAAVHAQRAEIYTDVDGVYTTDPRIEPNARKLHDIAYEEMLELASQGAGVMHPRAVEIGLLYDLPILVASSFKEDLPGTLIRKQVQMEPSNRVRGIALDRDVALITIRAVPDRPGIAAQVFGPLADAGINVDTIVQNASAARLTDLTFSVAHDQAAAAHDLCRQVAADLGAGAVILDEHAAKVSIVGTGMQSGVGYAAKMFRALAGASVNIELISTSEIRITAIVHEDDGRKAVQVLHAAFELDEPVTATS
ncbi:MAG: aspartate kinase [Chloroflexi bacterium]|nr:MAG: aspartate kinase [Chloroflexota bacterium]